MSKITVVPGRTSGLLAPWLWGLPFWILPALAIGLLSYAIFPTPMASVGRAAIGLSIVSVAAFALCSVVCRTPDRRFVAHALVGILFSLFAFTFGSSVASTPHNLQPVLQYVVVSLCTVLLVGLGPDGVASFLAPILKTMSVLLLLAIATGFWRANARSRTTPAIQQAIARVAANPHIDATGRSRPDIYQILLDGFGNPDTLRTRSAIDVGPIVDELKRRGFETVGDATSNYDQTYLSLASMWNMNYLEALERVSRDSSSRVGLHQLIAASALTRSLRSIGYRLEIFGADYSATHDIDADRCHCPTVIFGEFESAVLGMTPFGATGVGGLEYWPHRTYILRTFEEVGQFVAPEQPVFVFVHILAPHMPIVFDAQGRLPGDAQWRFSFGDGTAFEGTPAMLKRGYEGQARFIAGRTLGLVDHLVRMSRDRGRAAMIIIHGDHGIRLSADPSDPKPGDGREVLPILLAIRWAPTTGDATRVRSLVNVYREVFRRYFKADLPLLVDKGYVSSSERPFQFIPSPVGAE